ILPVVPSVTSSLCRLCVSLFFLLMPPPPTPTLFPYTTLFRSRRPRRRAPGAARQPLRVPPPGPARRDSPALLHPGRRARPLRGRSEEHTSELQSRENIVCRLLLEKKKKT